MRQIKFIAIITIIAITILSINEVGYIYEQSITAGFDGTTLNIPSIGLHTIINDESVDKGVYKDPKSKDYGSGIVVLFGHRTGNGWAFYNLDKLKQGDLINVHSITCDINYTVNNKLIVDPDYIISVKEPRNTIYLCTCTPIGTTRQRLIVECEYVDGV
jgi:LPXTG-site transpeptidase (sortase) family protein